MGGIVTGELPRSLGGRGMTYDPAMPFRRWLIAIVGLPVYLFALMILATTFARVALVPDELDPTSVVNDIVEVFLLPEWWLYVGGGTTVLVGLQAIFLLPLFRRDPPRETRGRSLFVSLMIAAAFAGLLCGGLGLAVKDLIIMLFTSEDPADAEFLWIIPGIAWLGGWAFWTIVMVLFTRDIWADRLLGRAVGVLLTGTAVEFLAVLPLDIMVRRRTDCYCATGTFFTLTIAGLACLWLAGPGVVVLLVRGRHRRWRRTHCDRCGYPRGPSPGACCPECGFAWGTDSTVRRRPVEGGSGPGGPAIDASGEGKGE